MANARKSARGNHGRKSYLRGSSLKQYGLQKPPRYLRHHAATNVNTIMPTGASEAMRAQQTRRHAYMTQHHSAESANTVLPHSPSNALLAQQNRRSAWYMARSDIPYSKSKKFMRIVKKHEKRLERDSDCGHWLDNGNSHQSSDGNLTLSRYLAGHNADTCLATKEDPLTIWHKYFHSIQKTSRAAGLAWIRYCSNNGWKSWTGRDRLEPSTRAIKDLAAYFLDFGADFDGFPRSMLCREARALLEKYDKLPIKCKPKELAKWAAKELIIARIWMVMEMIATNALETEKQCGFVATGREEKLAMLGLAPNVIGGVLSRGFHVLPLPANAGIIKPKIFNWAQVKNWAGVRDLELPLRENPDLGVLPRKAIDEHDLTDEEEFETDEEETEADKEEEETETDEEEWMKPDDDLMDVDDEEQGDQIEDEEDT
ncbi:MAG: hypothetical protein LQ346_004586 [Caloplaca aetnensis]|nr:MAG: hypothetical protein LQ346_004586 [Caloplaca aetnensis]